MEPTGKTLPFADTPITKTEINQPRTLLRKLEIWAPAGMVTLIQKCLETGLYGRTLEEAAERLIVESLERRFQPTTQSQG